MLARRLGTVNKGDPPVQHAATQHTLQSHVRTTVYGTLLQMFGHVPLSEKNARMHSGWEYYLRIVFGARITPENRSAHVANSLREVRGENKF